MTTRTLRQIELNAEVLSYIRGQLEQGNRLSKSVLDAVHLEDGTVYTTLPTAVSEEDVLHFRAGGLAKRAETEPTIVEIIREYLRLPGRLAVFEDKLASPTDSFLDTSGLDFVTCESQVYYFLTSSHAPEDIRRTIRFARSFTFIGVLSALPIGFSVPRTRIDVTMSFLAAMASTVDYLIVGAYDGEGELIWLSVR